MRDFPDPKIVGGDDGQKDQAKELDRKIFTDSKLFDEKYERDKTPEEAEVFGKILATLPDFLRRYAANPLHIRLEQIHMMSEEKIAQERKNDPVMDRRLKELEAVNATAFYDPHNHKIIILPSKIPLIHIAHDVSHELMHQMGFVSKQIMPDGVLELRRLGISSLGENKSGPFLLENVNEFVTEELNKRYCNEFFHTFPVLSADVRYRDMARKGAKHPDEVVSNDVKVHEHEDKETGERSYRVGVTIRNYSYPEQRKTFWNLIRFMAKEQKRNPEEIFRKFARAAMQGDLLELAREFKVFGPGALRELEGFAPLKK